jgi:hypothetical protein
MLETERELHQTGRSSPSRTLRVHTEIIADEDNPMGFGSKMAAEHRSEVSTLSRERHNKL